MARSGGRSGRIAPLLAARTPPVSAQAWRVRHKRPFDHPGGPWPNGTITHYWTDVGRYDVRVVQRWTGRWSLAGVGGELAGLVTEGVIEDFLVDELQAVINR